MVPGVPGAAGGVTCTLGMFVEVDAVDMVLGSVPIIAKKAATSTTTGRYRLSTLPVVGACNTSF